MNGHLTLSAAIPYAAAYQIGYDLNVHETTVRIWCRAPETDEEMSSGRRSPYDRFCDLVSAVYRSDKEFGPLGARRIVMAAVAHLDNLESEAEQPAQPPGRHELEEKLRRAEMEIAQIKAELRAQRRHKSEAVKR
jgi:hypothetical protein